MLTCNAEGQQAKWKLTVVGRALGAPQVVEFDREQTLQAAEPYVLKADLTRCQRGWQSVATATVRVSALRARLHAVGTAPHHDRPRIDPAVYRIGACMVRQSWAPARDSGSTGADRRGAFSRRSDEPQGKACLGAPGERPWLGRERSEDGPCTTFLGSGQLVIRCPVARAVVTSRRVV
jgi:hypothetical protein